MLIAIGLAVLAHGLLLLIRVQTPEPSPDTPVNTIEISLVGGAAPVETTQLTVETDPLQTKLFHQDEGAKPESETLIDKAVESPPAIEALISRATGVTADIGLLNRALITVRKLERMPLNTPTIRSFSLADIRPEQRARRPDYQVPSEFFPILNRPSGASVFTADNGDAVRKTVGPFGKITCYREMGENVTPMDRNHVNPKL